jgi:hypothetical protein
MNRKDSRLKKQLTRVALVALGLLAVPLLLWAGDGLQVPSVQSNQWAAEPRTELTAAQDRLYVLADYERVAIVDGASGERRHELPMAVFAADGSVAYAANRGGDEQAGNMTKVYALDGADGGPLREMTVAGLYDLPRIGPLPTGLSPNGRWLALQALPGPQTVDPQTWLVVLDTAFERPVRRVDLDGVFEFDALDNAGRSLYLIEYGDDWSAADTYRVRRYDLDTGALDPAVVADKRNGETEMAGHRQAAVASPDGQWLYSLYLHQPGELAFVHALNLDQGYAVCIDLPVEALGEALDLGRWGLIGSPDGETVYAANGGLGVVVEIETAGLSVRRMAELDMPEAAEGSPFLHLARWLAPTAQAKIGIIHPAALSPDGLTLYLLAREGILAVDEATLSVRDHYVESRTLSSLALSPDGKRTYALEPGPNQVLRLDPATWQVQAELASDDLWWGLVAVNTAGQR